MRPRPALLFPLALALICGCAAKTPPSVSLDDVPPEPDSYPQVTVAEFLSLAPAPRAERAEAADRALAEIEHHRKNRSDWVRQIVAAQRLHHWYDARINGPRRRYQHLLRVLEGAVAADPTCSRAWFELGRHREFLGDDEGAMAAYVRGGEAAAVDVRPDVDAKGARMWSVVYRAWCLHRLGRGSEGLALMEALREASGPGPLPAQVVYGLLLGDCGRFQEANDVALDVGPVEIPNLHLYSDTNFNWKKASYVERWIQANAWLGVGETALARHALGPLFFLRTALPFKFDYWQDVGLICDLDGDYEEARTAYATACTAKMPLMPFLDWDAFTTPPVIDGAPDVRVPVFSAYQDRLLSGSQFSLGVQLMSECSLAADDSVRNRKGRAADRLFTICIARGVRPTLSRALRGHVRYFLRDFPDAEPDLRRACDELALRDADDPATLLILGTLLFEDGRPQEAVDFLQRTVAVAPDLAGGWRNLGAALAETRRDDEALAAMDRAIELEPGSSRGWHNRGCFYAAHGDPVRASVDLGVALRLAPGEPATIAMAQRVARDLRLAASGDAALRAQATSDSLAARIPGADTGAVEERTGVITLGVAPDRAAHSYVPVDYETLADSLSAVVGVQSPPADRRKLADALLKCDRADEVAAILSLSDDPAPDPEDMVLLLRAERAQGDPARALRLVRDGFPAGDAELWSLVATICLDDGYRTEGLEALDNALALDPDNAGLKQYRQFVVSQR